MRKELRIKNQISELEKVAQFVEEIGEELGLSMELQMNLNLVMEEMVTNVIFYAYPEGEVADIELLAKSDGKELTFVLSDHGKEFDPMAKEGRGRSRRTRSPPARKGPSTARSFRRRKQGRDAR